MKGNKGVAFIQFNVKSEANNGKKYVKCNESSLCCNLHHHVALSLNGCLLDGSNRGLVVKYAEDQHKKKELNRLHNLTITAAFRGSHGVSNRPSSKRIESSDSSSSENFFYSENSYSQSSAGLEGFIDEKPQIYVHSLSLSATSQIGYDSVLSSKSRNSQVDEAMSFQSPNWYPPLAAQHVPYASIIPLAMHPNTGNQDFANFDQIRMSAPPGMPIPSALSQPIPYSNRSSHNSDIRSVPNPIQAWFSSSDVILPGVVTVYVDNLPNTASLSMLYDLFSPYGRVLSANIGESRNRPSEIMSGKVVMSSLAQAETAAHALNGLVLYEGAPPLQVKLFEFCTKIFALNFFLNFRLIMVR